MAEKLCAGCLPDEEAKTYVIKKSQSVRIKDIAWWERKKIKDIAQEALNFYLASKAEVPERRKA